MGGGNSKYIKSVEEKIESGVKKGFNLKEVLSLSNTLNTETLCSLQFEPV